jgi:DNA-directed RNA polymerase specialized sigma24 family protein
VTGEPPVRVPRLFSADADRVPVSVAVRPPLKGARHIDDMHDDIDRTPRTTPAATPARVATPAPGAPPDQNRTDATLAPRLRREWQWLHRRSDLVAAARGWRVTPCHFDDLEELLALAGYQCAATPERDEVLRRLVERAVDDELAARIVLQRILPGLLAVASRRGRSRRGADLFEELLGAAWITIRTYDIRRRPACLAAALICGAEHRAFRGPSRRRVVPEVPVDARRLSVADEADPSAAEELADVLRWARLQGLDPDDVAFVRRLATAASPAQLAAELGVTTRTIRNRRNRVTYRLRRLSVAA